MKFLIVITLEGGETLNLWAATENSGRMALNLLRTTQGIMGLKLRDAVRGEDLVVMGIAEEEET